MMNFLVFIVFILNLFASGEIFQYIVNKQTLLKEKFNLIQSIAANFGIGGTISMISNIHVSSLRFFTVIVFTYWLMNYFLKFTRKFTLENILIELGFLSAIVISNILNFTFLKYLIKVFFE